MSNILLRGQGFESRREVVDGFYGEDGEIIVEEYGTRIGDSGIETYQQDTHVPNPRTPLDMADVSAREVELTKKLRVIEHGDSRFEVSTITPNPGAYYTLHFSTYGSSLSNNAGNLYELAVLSSLYPDMNIIYVASFGNGGTSPILPSDRDYVSKFGRFTKLNPKTDEVEAIESLANLTHGLEEAGITPIRILGTDSAGGNYSTGAAVAMEPGQFESGFFSERSGVHDLKRLEIIIGILIKDNIINNGQNRALGDADRFAVNDERKEAAKAIYEANLSPAAREAIKVVGWRRVKQARSLWTTMNALRQGHNEYADRFMDDTIAMMDRHPEASVSFGLAEQDPLYKSPQDCREAVGRLVSAMASYGKEARFFVLPGMTHAYHTSFSEIYHAVRREALLRNSASS